MAKPFSYLAPTANQVAPKSALRKDDDLYANTAAIYANSGAAAGSTAGIYENANGDQHLTDAAVLASSTGTGSGPPVAAKPAAVRNDRLPGFNADWRLRSNADVSVDAPHDNGWNNVAASQTRLAERSGGGAAASPRTTHLGASNERLAASFRNVPLQPSEPAELAVSAFGSSRLIAPDRPTSLIPTTGEENFVSQYESASDLIRAAASAAAAKNDQPAGARRVAPLAPVVEDLGAGRSHTENGDLGGDIFDNFILVGAPHVAHNPPADPSHLHPHHQHPPPHPHTPPINSRLEGLFVSAGTSGDYKSAAVPTAADAPRFGSRAGGLNEPPAGRPRVFVEEASAGSRNDDPRYTFYSGAETPSTTVDIRPESATSSQYLHFPGGSSGSFLSSQPKMTSNSSSNNNNKTAVVDGGSDFRCGQHCRCSKSTAWIIVVVLIIVALVFFGVGFIAGWFGRSSTVESISTSTSSTWTSASTSTVPIAG